jgi:hypothetical protein
MDGRSTTLTHQWREPGHEIREKQHGSRSSELQVVEKHGIVFDKGATGSLCTEVGQGYSTPGCKRYVDAA